MIALFVENHIIDNAAVDNWVRHETKESLLINQKAEFDSGMTDRWADGPTACPTHGLDRL